MTKQKLVVVAKAVLEIPGEPRPKRTGTAVLIKAGKKAFPSVKAHPETVKAEENIQQHFFQWWATAPENLQKLLGDNPWEGPFGYRHTYYFPMPEDKKEEYPNLDLIYHTDTPDTDNLHKLSNDALEGFLYKNDSQGIDLGGVKYWSRLSNGLTVLEYQFLKEVPQ